MNMAAILLVQLPEAATRSNDFIIVMLYGIIVGLANGIGITVFDHFAAG